MAMGTCRGCVVTLADFAAEQDTIVYVVHMLRPSASLTLTDLALAALGLGAWGLFILHATNNGALGWSRLHWVRRLAEGAGKTSR